MPPAFVNYNSASLFPLYSKYSIIIQGLNLIPPFQ